MVHFVLTSAGRAVPPTMCPRLLFSPEAIFTCPHRLHPPSTWTCLGPTLPDVMDLLPNCLSRSETPRGQGPGFHFSLRESVAGEPREGLSLQVAAPARQGPGMNRAVAELRGSLPPGGGLASLRQAVLAPPSSLSLMAAPSSLFLLAVSIVAGLGRRGEVFPARPSAGSLTIF